MVKIQCEKAEIQIAAAENGSWFRESLGGGTAILNKSVVTQGAVPKA